MKFFVAILAIGLVGCTTVGPTPQRSATDLPASGALLPDRTAGEAPPECGFPPDTPLIFAGRSTTALLQVQEMIGDPMSNDPADIYITRDELDQGALRGRLVCAIYVNTPGFVEITMVPEGWSPETGRPPPTPTPEPTAVPERPATAIGRDHAIEVARDAVPHAADWDVRYVLNGPAAEVLIDRDSDEFAAIPDERWLWRIDFSAGDRATTVFVDYVTGEVYGSLDFIVN